MHLRSFSLNRSTQRSIGSSNVPRFASLYCLICHPFGNDRTEGPLRILSCKSYAWSAKLWACMYLMSVSTECTRISTMERTVDQRKPRADCSNNGKRAWLYKKTVNTPPVCVPRSWEPAWSLSKYSDWMRACKLCNIPGLTTEPAQKFRRRGYHRDRQQRALGRVSDRSVGYNRSRREEGREERHVARRCGCMNKCRWACFKIGVFRSKPAGAAHD